MKPDTWSLVVSSTCLATSSLWALSSFCCMSAEDQLICVLSFKLLTDEVLQVLDVVQQLAVGLDLDVVRVGHQLRVVDDHVPFNGGCTPVEDCAFIGDQAVVEACTLLVYAFI